MRHSYATLLYAIPPSADQHAQPEATNRAELVSVTVSCLSCLLQLSSRAFELKHQLKGAVMQDLQPCDKGLVQASRCQDVKIALKEA